MLIILFINKNISNTNIISILLLIYIIVYTFSLMINSFTTGHDLERLLASLNTLLTWMIALFYYQVFLNNKLCLEKIRKIVLFNFIILFGLYIFMLLLQAIGINEFSLLNNTLFFNSWYSGGEKFRFQAFLEYPNLVPLFFMIFLPFAIDAFREKKIKTICFFGLILIVVYASLSRSGLLALLAGILLFIFKRFTIRKTKLMIGLLCFAFMFILISISYVDSYIVETITQFAAAREGSNMTRGEIYRSSIEKAFIDSPLIGMGIKDLSPFDNLPYGSHSTYVGFFYKTGIIGLLIGTALLVSLNFKIYKQNKYFQNEKLSFFFYMFIAMTLMLIFEDLDGSNWLLVFYFSVAGIVLNKRNWSKSNENLLSDI